eukprot:2083213-Rhodomonas_salina.5
MAAGAVRVDSSVARRVRAIDAKATSAGCASAPHVWFARPRSASHRSRTADALTSLYERWEQKGARRVSLQQHPTASHCPRSIPFHPHARRSAPGICSSLAHAPLAGRPPVPEYSTASHRPSFSPARRSNSHEEALHCSNACCGTHE